MSEIDDHNIHIEEHMRYMLQVRFQVLKMKKPVYADAMIAHLNAHKQAKAAETMQSIAQIGAMGAIPEGGLGNAQ